MSMHYLDPKRENDPHALPNVEVIYMDSEKCNAMNLELSTIADSWDSWEVGFYWWTCFPGCLPDSDPHGPFASEDEALADAREGMDFDSAEDEPETDGGK